VIRNRPRRGDVRPHGHRGVAPRPARPRSTLEAPLGLGGAGAGRRESPATGCPTSCSPSSPRRRRTWIYSWTVRTTPASSDAARSAVGIGWVGS